MQCARSSCPYVCCSCPRFPPGLGKSTTLSHYLEPSTSRQNPQHFHSTLPNTVLHIFNHLPNTPEKHKQYFIIVFSISTHTSWWLWRYRSSFSSTKNMMWRTAAVLLKLRWQRIFLSTKIQPELNQRSSLKCWFFVVSHDFQSRFLQYHPSSLSINGFCIHANFVQSKSTN